MDSTSLKDFKPDDPDFDSEDEILKNSDNEIPASMYHEEINTLKIDKLSNRVTIISIIIPCLIGAILIFAYLDMKERVVDVDLTKQTQVDRISQQLDEKLNALDVKIAKNRFDLDSKLPEMNKKSISLEGQIAKVATTKVDKKAITSQLKKLETRVTKTANQAIEKLNKQTLSTIAKNQKQIDKTALQIKDEISLFKEEFDARLLELSDYEQQIGELRRDLSLLDKKVKGLLQESVSQASFDEIINQMNIDLKTHTKNLDQKINTLNQKLTTNLSRLQKDIDRVYNASSSTTGKPKTKSTTKPKPQINIDSSNSDEIKEESLTQ